MKSAEDLTEQTEPPAGEPTAIATPDTSDTIGTRIRALRTRRGWTLRDLAERAGISHGQLNQIESGVHTPRVDTLLAIARALSVDHTILLPHASLSLAPTDDPLTTRLLTGWAMLSPTDQAHLLDYLDFLLSR